MENALVVWEAPEHHHVEKNSDWYWILGIVAVAGAVLSLLFNNVLFAFFILIAAFTAALHAERKPRTMHFAISQRGIVANDKLYPFSSLDSFWIEDHEHHPEILIKSSHFFMPYIILPIGNNDPDDIHSVLAQFLPEVEHHETALHKALEYFGF